MKRYHLLYIILVIVSGIVVSCSGKKEVRRNVTDDPEKILAINKAMIAQEQDEIDDYVNRYQLHPNKTKTGLQYIITKEGKGIRPVMNDNVALSYTIRKLDGSYCYSSDSSGVLRFRLGQSDEPGGLQEGLLKLSEGSEAVLIVPSWLAYGMTGDGNKIGTNETLVYNLQLLKVN